MLEIGSIPAERSNEKIIRLRTVKSFTPECRTYPDIADMPLARFIVSTPKA